MNDRFDNTQPNVILLSDLAHEYALIKTFGVYKVARELRLAGYQVAVLHHAHMFTLPEMFEIMNTLVSDQTLFVGVNNFYFQSADLPKQSRAGIVRSMKGAVIPHDTDNNQFVQFVKSLNPNCKFVLGGPYAVDSSVNKNFDYVVIGYADTSAVNLANHLSLGHELKKSYQSVNGFTVVNDSTAPEFNFANSMMEYKDYDCILPKETLPLEVARGCIFKCAFCAYPLNGKKKFDFIKDRNLLKQELLTNYTNYQTTQYIMLDDTFNDSIEKVKMIYEISKELPFKLEYWAYIRLDLLAAHPETIDMLIESGLKAAHFGIESLNPETCRAVNKGGDRKKQWDTLRYIKQKWGDSIACHGSFIIGLPYESIESITTTFNELIAEDCPLDTWIMHQFTISSASKANYPSLIDKNPEDYGYIIDPEPIPGSPNIVNWKNEYLDYNKSLELAMKFEEAKSKKNNKKIDGHTAFNIAGLGIALDWIFTQQSDNINYGLIKTFKQKRADRYKKLFYEKFKIKKPILDNNIKM
jgi:hypothetical protein